MTIRRFSFHELSSRLASRVSTTVRASEGLLSVFRAVPVARRSVFPSKNQTLRAQRVAVTGAAFRGPKRHAGGRTAIRARALVHRTLFTKLGIFHDTGERPPVFLSKAISTHSSSVYALVCAVSTNVVKESNKLATVFIALFFYFLQTVFFYNLFIRLTIL